MTKIFLTADNHFNHTNIIKYCNRPYKFVEEMNEDMITKWNNVVGKEDIVIHLGDFAFRNTAKIFREKLNGTIILIRGNHDKYLSKEEGFVIIEDNLIIGNYIFSHRPLTPEENPNKLINVFGHIHHNPAYSGICVCVEQTEYTPIEFSKIFKPILS